MDTQRFDDLARAVAGGRSRRGLMRGLAGVAALWGGGRLSGASAHHGKAGPGDPCRTDSQCVAADAPMICANNGFGIDGSLNCCTYEGSRCGSDAWCCWDNVCINGVCTVRARFLAQVTHARIPPSAWPPTRPSPATTWRPPTTIAAAPTMVAAAAPTPDAAATWPASMASAAARGILLVRENLC